MGDILVGDVIGTYALQPASLVLCVDCDEMAPDFLVDEVLVVEDVFYFFLWVVIELPNQLGTMVRNYLKGTPSCFELSPEKNLKSNSILLYSDVLKILTRLSGFLTHPLDELLLTDEVGLVGVKLLEQPVAPEAVLLEEDEKVLKSEGMGLVSGSQVAVDEPEDVILLLVDWVSNGILR